MKKLFLLAALCVAATFSACSHDDVESPVLPEPPVVPEPQPLAIAFAEGNSLQFDVDETKTVHYTITGGSDKTVIKAEMQKSDDAYILKTTPTSAMEGTIAITAKTPETENCVVVTVSDGDRSITAEIAVSTKPIPEELAITFAEGNSLKLGVNETKTIHYTITGGSDKTVVKAEMQKSDNAYTLSMAPTSATEGTITISAKNPTDNCVLITVSDGDQSITAEIAVALKASFDGKTAVVVTPGTLRSLLADYDRTTITELTVIGNLNSSDIWTLYGLLNLAVLDMENANLDALPYQAFMNKESLTSVKLPKTLTSIGGYAFNYCTRLTSITIPDSVTEIGVSAFNHCTRLTGLIIGNGVTSIGWMAFSGCRSLTSITIPDSVTSIGGQAFLDCSSLASVTIGNGVTSIGWMAFSDCYNLTSVTIPDSVTSIGDRAFQGCSNLTAFYGKFASSNNRCLIVNGRFVAFAPVGLTSYTIPDSVTSIGEYAFWCCRNLTNIMIPNGVTLIGDYAFSGCTSLTSVTIPDSVTEIGNSAFWSCDGLTSITIPDNVTSIGDDAFCGCRSLTSVTIGNSVTTIGNEAFRNCSKLTSITISDSVRFIWDGAFQDCNSLTVIYCKAQTPPSVGVNAFNSVSTTLTLYVPIGCKTAYAAANEWKNFTIIETQF